MIDPVTGMIVGSALQIGTGAYADYQRRKAAEKAYKAQIEASKKAGEVERRAIEQATGTYADDIDMGRRYLDQYQAGIDSGEYLQPEFIVPEYNKTVQDFIDPNADYMQEQARRQLAESTAGQGRLISGSAMSELNKESQDIANMLYGQAYDRREKDEAKGYGYYIDSFNEDRNRTQQMVAQIQEMIARGDAGRTATNQLQVGGATSEANRIMDQGFMKGNINALPGQSRANFIDSVGGAANQGLNMYTSYKDEERKHNELMKTLEAQNKPKVGGNYPYRNTTYTNPRSRVSNPLPSNVRGGNI